MFKPCNKSFIQTSWEYLAHKCINTLKERHNLVIILDVGHKIWLTYIQLEIQDDKFLRDQSYLNHFRERRQTERFMASWSQRDSANLGSVYSRAIWLERSPAYWVARKLVDDY